MKATNKIGSMFLRGILLRMKELGVSQTELARYAETVPVVAFGMVSGRG